MNIALIGYGRMGKAIHALAPEQGVQIAHICNSLDDVQSLPENEDLIAIEFSSPDACLHNLQILAQKNISTVVGTTGWLDQLPAVQQLVAEHDVGLLYSSNFSIGVNLFWQITAAASQLMNHATDYDVCGHEYHHQWKKDSPSGTALTTADIVIDAIDRKDALTTETLQRPPHSNELHFTSTRAGHYAGTHVVNFSSPADEIEIKHTAKNRDGFALGAITAAKWMSGKKGLHTMQDMMADLFAKKQK